MPYSFRQWKAAPHELRCGVYCRRGCDGYCSLCAVRLVFQLMKNPRRSLEDRLEGAAQACHAAMILSCEATCREAVIELQRLREIKNERDQLKNVRDDLLHTIERQNARIRELTRSTDRRE